MSEFDSIEYTEESRALSERCKTAAMYLHRQLNQELDPSREKSLALTKLEECFMWLGKAIKAQQERRTEKERDGN